MKLSREVKTGIVVTVAIAATIWGFNYLKGTELFTRNNTYYALYDRIDGLAASNSIIMNGIKIGSVKKIRFSTDRTGRIIVTMQAKRDVFIPENSIARIISSDLFGGKSIEIIMGSSKEMLTNHDTLSSDLKSGIEQQLGPVKDKAEALIESLNLLTHSLNQLLDEKGRNNLSASFTNLNNITANFEKTTATLDQMISSPEGKLNRIISNTDAVTSTLKDNSQRIGKIIQQTEQITDSLAHSELAASINHLNQSLAELNGILKKVNQGEGSLGLLVNDKELYNKLTATTENLDQLLIDLKANPKRYVHFSLFGKRK
ncbi:MAG: MlaD family protein [Bacteroidia bacterium]|nr:MCE family protein [Bacteroidia bacterium]MCZ2276731.1 MlaD family protein [Bacteroidia bacterium]